MAKQKLSKKSSWIPKRDWDKLMKELEASQIAKIIKDMKPTSDAQVGSGVFDLSKCSKSFQDHFKKIYPKVEWP